MQGARTPDHGLLAAALAAIARATTLDHVREDRGALDVHLTREDVADLESSFSRQIPPQVAELR